MKSLVRFVTAFAVVTLLALPAAANAATSSEPAQPTDEQIAQQMSKDLDLSIEEARARVETQNRASGLTEDLQKALGNDFASMWMNDQGEVKVGILHESDRPAIEKALAEHRLDATNALRPVDTSQADLDAAQYGIGQELEKLPIDDRVLISTATDPITNAVIVQVEPGLTEKSRATLERLRDEFAKGRSTQGPPLPPVNPTPFGNAEAKATPQPAKIRTVDVNIKRVPKTTTESTYCSSESCDLPLRGGVKILNGATANQSAGQCSAGFIGKWWSGTQWLYFHMTAGHCLEGATYPTWRSQDASWNNSFAYGDAWTWRYGNHMGNPNYLPTFDAGIINMASQTHWTAYVPWPGQIWMHGWPGGGEGWNITNQDLAWVNEYGCRSGYASSFTCGNIFYLNLEKIYSDQVRVSNLIVVPNACPTPGDSGGVFADGNRAVGITSAVSRNGDGSCAYGLYSKVTDITAWLGVSIL